MKELKNVKGVGINSAEVIKGIKGDSTDQPKN